MIRIPVDLGPHGYDVLVGDGASASLAELLGAQAPGARRAAVVTDEVVACQPWFDSLDPGIPFTVHAVASGEGAKRLSTVESLARAFAREGLSRADVVVGVGGGVVTDLAGFVAATYHRGIAYCPVATTLLAQVDAAVGGKTGVNLPEGKNLVGAFWQPIGVVCDTATLVTLPQRELACGRGEMAKYAFLGLPSLADLPLEEQVSRSVACKAAFVAEDEREADRRMLLNYGHTLAHSLEAEAARTGRDVRHGEAVAVGLVYAALVAYRLRRIDGDRVALHRSVVERFGLRATLPGEPGSWDHEELLKYMARDKKAAQDLAFILDGEGGLALVHGVDRAVAAAALDELEGLAEAGVGGAGVGGAGSVGHAGGPGPSGGRRMTEGPGPRMHLTVLSGPNLNLLGEREPEVYGTARLEDHVRRAGEAAAARGWTMDHQQTNHEGELVEAVHAARHRSAALVVNAGALSHTSWSLHDALAAFEGVVIEVHLSNPAAREPFRHSSVLAPVADGLVAGMGGLGYELAVEAAIRLAAAGGPREDLQDHSEEER
jgi:5-deoxy-5-amino-3-dehydroquinate synthase